MQKYLLIPMLLCVGTLIAQTQIAETQTKPPQVGSEGTFLIEEAAYKRPKSPDEALERLVSGNKRYADDKTVCPDRHQERRMALISKQKPFAVIVGCSDSRVSPEILFDQGVGDLFVVRVAGNVVGPLEMDSIDYSVAVLKSSVVLVLGHQSCGAVTAVVNGQTADIQEVAKLIEPAVASVRGKPGDPVENAIKANVKRTVEQLKTSKIFAPLIQEQKLKIVGGYYHLENGIVELI
jgi:carbonic anhydrase